MARVTATEVKEIIKVPSSVTTVDTFIIIANEIVTEKLGSSGLSATRLKEIERWLTAHYLALTLAKMAEDEEIDDVSKSYFGDTDGLKYLEATQYGQTVLTLDTTGTLSDLGKRKFSFKAIPETD